MTSSISLFTAFVAGLASFLSPCVLPIVPGYLSFISGVNPRLVFAMREAIDREWTTWKLDPKDREIAERYCRDVKIAVTGGFTPAKIRQFEDLIVPADIYGVGSWLLSSCDVCGTNTDFTADVVRVRIDGRWYDLAKVGRKACDNLMLERVQ